MTKHSLLIILICGFLVQCTQTTQNEKSNEKSNNYPAILVVLLKNTYHLIFFNFLFLLKPLNFHFKGFDKASL